MAIRRQDIDELVFDSVSGVVSDTAYGSGWNGDLTHAPSKNAIYDKIETISTHTQNTDTGTTANTFVIDSDSTTGKITLDVTLNAGQNRNMTITNEAMTADRTITLPDKTGTVSLDGHTHNLYNESIILDTRYKITADDTWETVITSGIFTYAINIQITAQFTIVVSNVPAYIMGRLVNNNTSAILGIGRFEIIDRELQTFSLIGNDGVDNGDTISLQIYAKQYDVIEAEMDSYTKATAMNIIGFLAQ